MKITATHLQLACIAIMLLVGIAWMAFQWTECRGMGFSFWYCLQHIA